MLLLEQRADYRRRPWSRTTPVTITEIARRIIALWVAHPLSAYLYVYAAAVFD
jgi:hypothetical protein